MIWLTVLITFSVLPNHMLMMRSSLVRTDYVKVRRRWILVNDARVWY